MSSQTLHPSFAGSDTVRANPRATARVVAVCVSVGGVPKRPIPEAEVSIEGICGDLHAHVKHNRPDRALSLFDLEILRQLVDEGFALAPGTAGENITVEGLNVQELASGTLLKIGEALIRLEMHRKPCYVLDAINPQLKEVIVGRCGYMASVLKPGTIRPGMVIQIIESDLAITSCASSSCCPSRSLG